MFMLRSVHYHVKRVHDHVKRVHDHVKRVHDHVKRVHDHVRTLHGQAPSPGLHEVLVASAVAAGMAGRQSSVLGRAGYCERLGRWKQHTGAVRTAAGRAPPTRVLFESARVYLTRLPGGSYPEGFGRLLDRPGRLAEAGGGHWPCNRPGRWCPLEACWRSSGVPGWAGRWRWVALGWVLPLPSPPAGGGVL